jgi:hypothetical protein
MDIMSVVIHGTISIIEPKVFCHKKSVDLVTGNFLLRVVTLLSNLSSKTSGLFQSRLIGKVVVYLTNECTFKAV